MSFYRTDKRTFAYLELLTEPKRMFNVRITLQVYDFTPVQGETNWKKAGRMFKVEDYLPLPSDIELIKELGINNDPQRSTVPRTTGLDGKG